MGQANFPAFVYGHGNFQIYYVGKSGQPVFGGIVVTGQSIGGRGVLKPELVCLFN